MQESTSTALKYLWAYSSGDEWTDRWHEQLIARRRAQGYDVEGFCVTPPSLQKRWLAFDQLDRWWRAGHPKLIGMYEQLIDRLQGRDVLILYNGANLHPEFVGWLSLIRVYTAGDDPESTEVLTRPLAPAFDIHLVNNAACVDMYRSWGLRRVHFWPLGSQTFPEECDDLTETMIRDLSARPIPYVLCCGRSLPWRQDRLDLLERTFPEAFFAGKGWPRGYVDREQVKAAYRQAQIGWNLHNSTGPVNFRAYELPAYGVMQICDSRAHLGQLYAVGHEVAGFETMEECIDLTRYYAAHREEQREIAVAGWKRWKADYTPDRVWEKLDAIVRSHLHEFPRASLDAKDVKRRLWFKKYRWPVGRMWRRWLNRRGPS